MKASEIMTSNPHTCHPQDRVCDAVKIMKDFDCGSVPIVDGSGGVKLVGIITDRDIALKMCEQEKTCREISIESCMSKPVYFCHTDDNIQKVEHMMREHQLHRIPVLDQNETLQGMIALADLAREVNKEKQEGAHEISEEEVAEIVEDISKPCHA